MEKVLPDKLKGLDFDMQFDIGGDSGGFWVLEIKN